MGREGTQLIIYLLPKHHSHPERFSSGTVNSRTSFVGMFFIFSDLRAGIESSSTVPRRGRSSLVRTIILKSNICKFFRHTLIHKVYE